MFLRLCKVLLSQERCLDLRLGRLRVAEDCVRFLGWACVESGRSCYAALWFSVKVTVIGSVFGDGEFRFVSLSLEGVSKPRKGEGE